MGAIVALVGSGLFLAGPFDLLLASSLVPLTSFAFVASALVLIVLEVMYFGRVVPLMTRAPHWPPIGVGIAVVAVSALGLASTRWDVHLYGPWVLFFLATCGVALLGTAIVLGAVVWGLVAQRNKERGVSQGAG